MTRARVLLAAGGTGGHVFPAIAVADELLRRGLAVALATDSRGAALGGFPEGVARHRIASSAGGGPAAMARGCAAVGLGVLQAWRLIARLRPSCVAGFGGYPSVPTMLAAVATGRPSLIHEQNGVLGRANRLVAGRAEAIALSFEETAGLAPAARARAAVTGNPVRAAFGDARRAGYAPPRDGEALRLLVLGGSQGARVFGEILPEAFSGMPGRLRGRFEVAQQCRAEDLEATRRAYRAIGVPAELATFFDDVPARMADAHLVVARSGASTAAELAEAGRPAVLVPYPHAADGHQAANARILADRGGAWPVPEDAGAAEALRRRLERLAARPDELGAAARAMRACGGRDAARALADRLEALAAGPAAEAAA